MSKTLPQKKTVEEYYELGVKFRKNRDYKQSIKAFTKVVELSPREALGYCARGVVYSDIKEYKKALRDYNHALSLDPNFAEVYNNRGMIYEMSKKWSQAIADYKQAILHGTSNHAYLKKRINYLTKKIQSEGEKLPNE